MHKTLSARPLNSWETLSNVAALSCLNSPKRPSYRRANTRVFSCLVYWKASQVNLVPPPRCSDITYGTPLAIDLLRRERVIWRKVSRGGQSARGGDDADLWWFRGLSGKTNVSVTLRNFANLVCILLSGPMLCGSNRRKASHGCDAGTESDTISC